MPYISLEVLNISPLRFLAHFLNAGLNLAVFHLIQMGPFMRNTTACKPFGVLCVGACSDLIGGSSLSIFVTFVLDRSLYEKRSARALGHGEIFEKFQEFCLSDVSGSRIQF